MTYPIIDPAAVRDDLEQALDQLAQVNLWLDAVLGDRDMEAGLLGQLQAAHDKAETMGATRGYQTARGILAARLANARAYNAHNVVNELEKALASVTEARNRDLEPAETPVR